MRKFPAYRTVAVGVVATAIVLGSALASAQTLVVDGPDTLAAAATFDSVRVLEGGSLVVDAPLTVVSYMVVEAGARVGHSRASDSGLRIEVGGILEVQLLGAINVTGGGLRGGWTAGNSSANGQTYDDLGNVYAGVAGNVIIGTAYYAGAGASYGGEGGYGGSTSIPVVSNSAYGLLENPDRLGSGGGGINIGGGGSAAGGNGGGLVHISAAECIVNGSILANGTNAGGGYGTPGGGSGGSIRLDVGTLRGDGVIEANGGAGLNTVFTGGGGGSGGGGRIAIYYETNLMAIDQVRARGGSNNHSGAAGTIYLKSNRSANGYLAIGNGGLSSARLTPIRTDLESFGGIGFQGLSRVVLEEGTSVVVEDPIELLDFSLFQLSGSLEIVNGSGFDLTVRGGSRLVLDPLAVVEFDAVRVAGGELASYRDLSFPVVEDFELSDRGTVSMFGNTTLSLGEFTPTNIQNGTVVVPVGSQIDVASLSVTVGDSVTLVKDGFFGESDILNSLNVQRGGIVSHSGYAGTGSVGLNLNLQSTLEIEDGGIIQATGRGLRGGIRSGNPSANGETYNEQGGVQALVAGNRIIGSAYYAGAGASYGGEGGYGGSASIPVVSNAAYGLLENSDRLGSGGGGINIGGGGSAAGGNGGGLVHVSAAECIVNGSILANGTNAGGGYGTPGGGSGGSIRLDVDTLRGEGVIEANGGAGLNTVFAGGGGGSGSGGRIAIYYKTNLMTSDQVRAHGGSNNHSGAAGTIFVRNLAEASGNLIIDNRGTNSARLTPNLTHLLSFKEITVRNYAILGLIDQVTVEHLISVTDQARVVNAVP